MPPIGPPPPCLCGECFKCTAWLAAARTEREAEGRAIDRCQKLLRDSAATGVFVTTVVVVLERAAAMLEHVRPLAPEDEMRVQRHARAMTEGR